MAEELQAHGGREILALPWRGGLHVFQLRAEGVVEIARAEGARVQRTGHKLPERLEILELRTARVIVMRGRVMDVGREPNDVLDAGMLDEGEEIGNFELAAERWAVALGDRLRAPLVRSIVPHDEPQRHVGRDHLPGGARVHQRALEPGELLGTKEHRLGSLLGLHVVGVRSPVAAHVEKEDVKRGPTGYLAVDARRLLRCRRNRHIFVEGAGRPRGQQRHLLHRVAVVLGE